MVIVCGADGFVGNNLTRALLAAGHDVRCLVPPVNDPRSLAGLQVETVIGDVLLPSSLLAAFEGADVVYNVAGVIAIRPGREQLMEAVNATGARNVAEACVRAGVRRLCHVSSCHALQEPPHGQIFDESQPFGPTMRMAYGRTKAKGALAVLEVADRHGLDAVIACPTGIMGPYDFQPSEMGRMVVDFATGRLAATAPGGFDFVDVRDVANGLIALAQRGRSGEYYLLSGEWVEVAWIIEQLHAIFGASSKPRLLSGPLLRFSAAVSSALSRLTGQMPRITPDSVETLLSSASFSSAKAAAEVGYAARPLARTLVDVAEWFQATGRIRHPATAQGLLNR